MKLESLTVELRPRSGWEALELGSALVRRHAAAIWRPWLVVTCTVFALFSLLAWSIDRLWLAPLLMWWVRPVFDRIPLYVLSRSVFGTVPATAETLRAQLHWGWRHMFGHLTWRRFSPWRPLLMPVDLLEGAQTALTAERKQVIANGTLGTALLLATCCQMFMLALQASILLAFVAFSPDLLSADIVSTARKLGAFLSTVLDEQPPAIQWLTNLAGFAALCVVEPFYIGAGFGLYLNRRTQLEAWDLEIAFRRMRKRLEALTATTLLALICALPVVMPWTARAQDAVPAETQAPAAPADGMGIDNEKDGAGDKRSLDKSAADDAYDDIVGNEKPKIETWTLPEIFGDQTVADESFGKSVGKALRDPLLKPKQKITGWEPREKKKKDKDETPEEMPAFVRTLSAIFGFLAEYGLWILVGLLVLALLATAKRWWPWLSGMAARPELEQAPVEVREIGHDEPLPPDIASAARALWARGQPRRALALLYRASVEAMALRIGAHLPPGATEAECLRLSRRMGESEDRDAFQRVVRVWQYAAYGHSLPDNDDFESLLSVLAQRFRWSS